MLPTAHTLTPRLVLLLNLPPLMWAGNAIVGRLAIDLAPPIALNALRWSLCALLLALLAPGGWRHRALWRRHAVYIATLGLLGIGCYNALQYWALHTSSPINVTLIAASMPVWMLLVGRIGFAAQPRRIDIVAALFSLTGALLVVVRGDWHNLLALRLLQGDLLMLVATLAWAIYSWLLAKPPSAWVQDRADAQPPIDWASWLLIQCLYGLVWCAASAGIEFAAAPLAWHWSAGQHGWELAALLLFVAVGPSIIAFRCWGIGVAHMGPAITSLFGNLTPVYAALLSAALLGQWPQPYHLMAFALIGAGIVLSARR